MFLGYDTNAALAFLSPFSSTTSPNAALFKTTSARQRQPQTWIRNEPSIVRLKAAAATSTEEENASAAERYAIATQLLGLLLDQRTEDIEPPFEAFLRRITPSYETVQSERSSAVEALIEQLTRPVLAIPPPPSKGLFERLLKPPPTPPPTYYYDPGESLFGSFYCTLYFYYPNDAGGSGGKPPEDPIWEKTSLKASNIKGQQYYLRNDFSQSVINYSEVWGPAFSIGAEGVLTPIGGNDDKDDTEPTTKEGSRNLRRLPDVFKVDATKVTVSAFGFQNEFDIEGSANLVVLYADPRIRIFVSPLASETVVGNWEEAGLVVVQVRGDLVPPENASTPQIIDLR